MCHVAVKIKGRRFNVAVKSESDVMLLKSEKDVFGESERLP